MPKQGPTILHLGDFMVDSRICTDFFACDLSVCRGACCIEGDGGPPLESDEIELLGEALPSLKGFVDAPSYAALEEGVAYRDADGDWLASLEPVSKRCAFCQEGAAGLRCALTIARERGVVGVSKPRSCDLYPIRVASRGALTLMRYDVWAICDSARERGRCERVRVYEFLKEPLTRYYGSGFYEELSEAARSLLGH